MTCSLKFVIGTSNEYENYSKCFAFPYCIDMKPSSCSMYIANIHQIFCLIYFQKPRMLPLNVPNFRYISVLLLSDVVSAVAACIQVLQVLNEYML